MTSLPRIVEAVGIARFPASEIRGLGGAGIGLAFASFPGEMEGLG